MFSDEEIKKFNEDVRISEIKEACQYLFIKLDENNAYPIKRAKLNSNFIATALIYIETSSVSGGSCWDESTHYDCSVSNKQIFEEQIEAYIQLLDDSKIMEPLEIDIMLLKAWIEDKLKQESRYQTVGEFYKHEYYGNSTTFSLYKLDINEIIDVFCTEEIQMIYKKQLETYQNEPRLMTTKNNKIDR